MTIVLNGTTGITNDGGYTGDGVSFADTTPANTLVTTTDGRVGVGTSSPSTKLTIASSTYQDHLLIDRTGVGSMQITASNPRGLAITDGTNVMLQIAQSSGNVGIGTSSPISDAKLTISAPLEPTLFFQRSDAGNNDAAIQVSSGGAFIFKNGADSSTAAGLTERMRIDGSGNVYVGADTACNLTDFRTQSKAASGYQKLAGGVYLQWGSLTVTNNVTTTITFPIAFPTACQSAQFTCRSTDGSSIFFWDMRSLSASSTSIYTGRPSGGSSTLTTYWFAIGY